MVRQKAKPSKVIKPDPFNMASIEKALSYLSPGSPLPNAEAASASGVPDEDPQPIPGESTVMVGKRKQKQGCNRTINNDVRCDLINVQQHIEFTYIDRQAPNSPEAKWAFTQYMQAASEAMMRDKLLEMEPECVALVLQQIEEAQHTKLDQKYDYELQRKIWTAQRLPLLPALLNLTSDGPGLELDAPLLMHATKMSMNKRFA